MSKPTKTELSKYKQVLEKQLASLRGDVGSMKDEALRASDQDASVDHLADQGTDNYDQGFMLGLIENEEETIKLIEEALDRIAGRGEWDFGVCPACQEEIDLKKAKDAKKDAKKVKDAKPAKPVKAAKTLEVWIPKARLEYLPWARYCVRHQEVEERNRESA
jgi:RNA polymerase-binding transcription factor DksA